MRDLNKSGKIRITLILLVLLAGCTARKRQVAQLFVPPRSVALLPLSNETNDLKIAPLLRKLFFKKLRERPLNLIPLPAVDSILLHLGITDGGQLPAVRPMELANSLHAEWLVYGNVSEASYITVGFFLKKCVRIDFRIFSTTKDTTIWAADGEGVESELNLDPKEAAKELLEQLKTKALSGIFDHPLREEANKAIEEVARNLYKVCR